MNTDELLQLVKDKLDVKDYEHAYTSAKQLCEKVDDLFESHYYMAIIFFMLQQFDQAMDEVSKAIDMDPSDFNAYELSLILLLRNHESDTAHMVITMLTDSQLDEYISIRWCKAWLDLMDDKDLHTVLEHYIDVDRELEQSGKDYYWVSEFYYQYAHIMDDSQDRKTINWNQIIEILDKGLQSYPENLECLEYKAWLLTKARRYDEAQTIYEKLIRIPHNGFNLEWQLAGVYYRRLTKYADKALDLYKCILEYEEDAELHYYAGMCEFKLGHFKEAEMHFLKEQEIDPDDPDGYYRLSYVYEVENRMEEALEQIDMAIDIVRKWDRDQSDSFIQKSYILRKMGRMEEAAKTIEEAAGLYKYFKKYPHLVNIWEQAGNWEKVEETLEEWKNTTKARDSYRKEQIVAQIKYYLLRDNFTEAKSYYEKYKKVLTRTQKDDLDILIDSIDGKTENNLKIWMRGYKSIEPDNLDYPYYVLHYAKALWQEGKTKKAKEMAEKALELLDEQLKGFHTNKTVMIAQKACALFLLGRVEEAKEQAKEVRERPMCDFCPYATCKDIDIYEIEGLLFQNKIEEAITLLEEYRKKWPEETDFVFLQNILKKR